MAERARRPAPAGPRSPPPGEEQPPGRRLAAQHPRPQRDDARGQAPPIRRSAGGSTRCRSSTATISPRWRKAAALRCARCWSSLPPTSRRSAPPEAREDSHPARRRHRPHHPGRGGGGRLPRHRDRRVRHARHPARRSRSSCAAASELAARADHFQHRADARRRQATSAKEQFERIVGGLARQLRSPLDGSSAATALNAGLSRLTERPR